MTTNRKDTEHQLQCQIIELLRFKKYVVFSIPNHGIRSPRLGAYYKREGLLPGVADLFIMAPKITSSGVFVEVKSENGVQSKTQKEFELMCREKGYRYWVIRSIEEFIKKLTQYEIE